MSRKRYLVEFDIGLDDAFGKSLEILTEEEMETLKSFIKDKKVVYLGEISGKHSEIFGRIDESDYKIVSENLNDIEVFENLYNGWFGAYHMMGAIYDKLEE